MRNLKYGCVGVVIDCDNFLAVTHSRLMLNCAAYTDGYIEVWPNGCAGLSDLMVTVDKT
jgi:hypothetical protein